MPSILIRGARTHNLRNIDLELPRDRLIVFTGLSGSGKSSLAFDTIYAEGQRRYVESLSAYARQFLSMMEKPDVDSIEGLSPAIAIEQKSTSHNPRSTVGTVTEIYDHLRLLFARVGTPRCPDHGVDLAAQTVSQMVDQVMRLPEGTPLLLLAPLIDATQGRACTSDRAAARTGLRARAHRRHVVEAGNAAEARSEEANTRSKPSSTASKCARTWRSAWRNRSRRRCGCRMAWPASRSWTMQSGSREELVFSDKFACPICGYSLAELEPRLFSFNNPAGACPTCSGLGVQQFFDPARVVHHPHLSLAGGAIRGWDRRNAYYFALMQSLARHYKFDVEEPWQDLAAKHQKVVLYGSGEDKIDFRYVDANGGTMRRAHKWEGVIPNLERRYRETESLAVREELAKYLSNQPCPECGGTRLNRAARNVFVAERTLPEIAKLAVSDALRFSQDLQLEGWRGEIAAKIVKEIGERLRFLSDVGLDYLTLDRSADTLSGGEAQRIRLASQIGSGLVGVMYILDEPSIGLHQRDNDRLLRTLNRLRDLGNTVIVVEHDEDAIRHADHVVDLGPGAGVHGGRVIAQGTPEEVAAMR